MIYAISYDLKKPGQDYSQLIKAIKAIGGWAKPLESYWLVSTTMSASDIFNRLKPYMDSNDSMLVTKFNEADYSGWLSKEIWTWISNQKSAVSRAY